MVKGNFLVVFVATPVLMASAAFLIFAISWTPTGNNAYAGKDFDPAVAIMENCSNIAGFAEYAGRDRHSLPLKAVLPYYFEMAKKSLAEMGYTPILTKSDKHNVVAAARFMYKDKTRTVDDYKRACLLNEEGTSPLWYAEWVQNNGVPGRIKIRVVNVRY